MVKDNEYSADNHIWLYKFDYNYSIEKITKKALEIYKIIENVE